MFILHQSSQLTYLNRIAQTQNKISTKLPTHSLRRDRTFSISFDRENSSSGYIESTSFTMLPESRTKSFVAGNEGATLSDKSNCRKMYCLSLRSDSLEGDANDEDDEDGAEDNPKGGPDRLPLPGK